MHKALRFRRPPRLCWYHSGLLFALLGLAPAASGQTLSLFATYSTGSASEPSSVALADLNGDGKPDIVVATAATTLSTHTIGILLGNGNGTFQPLVPYTSQSSAFDVAIADLNGDNKPDVLTANVNGTVGVLLGNGTGTLQPMVTYPAGSSCYSIDIADLNGDGQLDVLTANRLDNKVGVLLGTGTGALQPVVAYSVGPLRGLPSDMAVGDVNGDGQLDIISANSADNSAGVLLGNGNGTFQAAVTYSVSTGINSAPTSVAVADINRDGKLDIIAATGFPNVVSLLLGTGTGTFQAATTFSTGSGSFPTSVAVADMNRDGKLDIVAANYASNSVAVLLGNGTGTFSAGVTYVAGTNSNPRILAVADVNGDGKPDVVTANYATNSVAVLLNITLLATSSPTPSPQLTLWPNPSLAGEHIALTVNNLLTEMRNLEATLINPMGQVISQLTLPTAPGKGHIELPTRGLASGLYLLRLRAQNAQGTSIGTLPVQHLCIQ